MEGIPGLQEMMLEIQLDDRMQMTHTLYDQVPTINTNAFNYLTPLITGMPILPCQWWRENLSCRSPLDHLNWERRSGAEKQQLHLKDLSRRYILPTKTTSTPPKKLTCPLKRGHFKRKVVFHIFQGKHVSFPGVHPVIPERCSGKTYRKLFAKRRNQPQRN